MSLDNKRFRIKCDNQETDGSMYLECKYESWLHPDYTEKHDYVEFEFYTGDGGYDMEVVATSGKKELRLEHIHKISLKINGGWERELLVDFLNKVVETEKIIGIIK